MAGFYKFILLSTIINQTLYTTIPRKIKQCFVCLDTDRTFNDSWPSDNWYPMQIVNNSFPPTCKIKLNDNITTDIIFGKIAFLPANNNKTIIQESWFPILYNLNIYSDNLKCSSIFTIINIALSI